MKQINLKNLLSEYTKNDKDVGVRKISEYYKNKGDK